MEKRYYRVCIKVVRAEALPKPDGIVVVREIAFLARLFVHLSLLCCIFLTQVSQLADKQWERASF